MHQCEVTGGDDEGRGDGCGQAPIFEATGRGDEGTQHQCEATYRCDGGTRHQCEANGGEGDG